MPRSSWPYTMLQELRRVPEKNQMGISILGSCYALLEGEQGENMGIDLYYSFCGEFKAKQSEQPYDWLV